MATTSSGCGRRQRWLLGAGIAAVVGAAGCHRDRERVGTTTVHSARLDSPSSSIENAADRILAAHCNHEQLCKEYGYPAVEDHDACISTTRAVLDRARQDCSLGISKDGLSECLGAIRAAPCSTEASDLEAIGACATSELCSKVDAVDINGNWRGFPGL